MFKWLEKFLGLWRHPPPIAPQRPEPIDDSIQAAYRAARGRTDEIIRRPPPIIDAVASPEPEVQVPVEEPVIWGDFRTSRNDFRRTTANVLHPKAIYHSNGREIPVYNDELFDDVRFLEIRRLQLFTPDCAHRLGARKGPDRIPHFWTLTEKGQQHYIPSTDFVGEAIREDGDIHEKRVGRIFNELRKHRPSELFTVDWDTYNKNYGRLKIKPDISQIADVEQFTLANISGYRWRKNSGLIDLSGAKVRPDIVGTHPDSEDIIHPPIFIEVINTHYPEPNTWNAYLEHSFRMPLIVLFEFTQEFNYHLQVRNASNGSNAPNDVRAIHYIWQGSLMKNLEPQRKGIIEYSSEGFRYQMADELKAIAARRRAAGRANGANPGITDPN